MTVVSFMQRQLSSNQTQGHKSLEIDIEVDPFNRTFDLKPKLRTTNRSLNQHISSIRGISLENKGGWNFLLLHFTKA